MLLEYVGQQNDHSVQINLGWSVAGHTIAAGTQVYLDSPANTAWIVYNSTLAEIEFYVGNAKVGGMS